MKNHARHATSEQSLDALVPTNLVYGICQVFVVKLTLALVTTCPLNLQPQLTHVKRISQSACQTACQHAAHHRLQEADVLAMRYLFSFLLSSFYLLEIISHIVLHT